MEIKYSKIALNKADKQIKELIRKVILTKKGGTTTKGQKTPARALKKKSGFLYKNVKPIIKVDKSGDLEIDIEVMKYYQYLDEGTKRIKHPWFLTDEILKKAEFLSAIEELMASGVQNTVIDIISNIEDID